MSRRVVTVSLTVLVAVIARPLPAQAPQPYSQPPGPGFQGPGGQFAPPPDGQPYAAQPSGAPGGAHPFAGPTQPVVPNTPASQRVIRPPVMHNAPFQLTKAEFDSLMAVLSGWERHSSQVDLLRCNMEILEYDLTFPIIVPTAPGKPKQVNPNHIWQGELKYQAPDKGWFEAKSDNAMQKWIVDGKSVYQFDYHASKVIRRDLPPELRGAGIGDGPLPFFFGAKADRLVKRYFMRLLTPANLRDRQVWIEAYPRFQFDAANFRRATIILDAQTVMPMALEIYSPTGNERSVYKFSGTQIGRNLLEKIFNQNIFQVDVPSGWQMVVNPGANPPRAAAAPTYGTRR
jgi:TIGR03009 family protein